MVCAVSETGKGLRIGMSEQTGVSMCIKGEWKVYSLAGVRYLRLGLVKVEVLSTYTN